MFASKVAKPQGKVAESSISRMAPQRASIPARPFGGSAIEQALFLQRTIGNQATLRLLARQPSSSGESIPVIDQEQKVSTETMMAQELLPRGPSWDFSKIPLFPPERADRVQPLSVRSAQPGLMQPKLAIGDVNDPLEREAEKVADEVMHTLTPEAALTSAAPQVNRKCASCEEEDEKLQRKEGGRGPEIAPPIVHEVLRSPGQPLGAKSRAFFEPRFGHDFSQVRVHADDRSSQSARAVNALAYTVGPQIVFGAGLYQPDAPSGQRLLAHELTHVVQQQGQLPVGPSLRMGPSSDPYEQEAERAASATTGGEAFDTAERASGLIQRQASGPSPLPKPATAAGAIPKPETCKPPADMDKDCSPTTDPVTGAATTINFVVDKSDLDHTVGDGRAEIKAAADQWRKAGASGKVRVDAYASAEYECEYNWRLSCRRAKAVRDELKKQGVPEANISLFAHGESDEAGATLAANRRATISLPAAAPPPKPTPVTVPPKPEPENKCGPDITSALSATLTNVGSYFDALSGWQKRRSCMALTGDAPLAGVNPIMAWDIEELFLPNTWWLDSHFRLGGCGSPRDPGCETDPTRNLCETAGTCGNTVLVGGKCMLAGTANYALYGKMYRLCTDEFFYYFRFQMRNLIRLYKLVGGDDSGPPLAMATAAFDGDFPTVPAEAENRGKCTGRCATRPAAFHFIWEPYKSR